MKRIIGLFLVLLIATTSVFAYVEEYWNAGDVEDVLFDGSHVVFDSKWGNPGIYATYAQESWSIGGGLHGFKFKMNGSDLSDMFMGATLAGSYRSENVRLGLLLNFTGTKNSTSASNYLDWTDPTNPVPKTTPASTTTYQTLGIGIAGSFWQNKIRFAVPLTFEFKDNKVALTTISPAYIKYVVNAGTLSFLRFRVNYTDLSPYTDSDNSKGLNFQLDGNFYQEYAERFGIETLVRLGYATQTGLASGVKADQKPYLYVEPYIFGYTEGNVIQVGLVPFGQIGGNLKDNSFGIDEYGLEIRTEFQPVKNLRVRVSVQAYNDGDWAAKWNCRAAWYY